MSNGKSLSLAVAALAVLSAALAVGASGAGGSFVEQDVKVLHEFHSNGPAPGGSYFGWAVSELGDVDGDGVEEAIVSEPYNGADTSTGTVYVYSGRTGRLLYRFDGEPGDQYGFSIADAGDTNRDGVHDILVGAPGNGAGHVDLYSGRTGALLHRFVGSSAGDAFGWSVSSAGDVDHDHHADVLIGAPQAFGAVGPGYATIYSGRTYEPIRTLTGDVVGDQFGSGAGQLFQGGLLFDVECGSLFGVCLACESNLIQLLLLLIVQGGELEMPFLQGGSLLLQLAAQGLDL